MLVRPYKWARGEQEAKGLRGIITAQRARIQKTAASFEQPQAFLPFDPQELKTLDSNKKYWSRRLEELAGEIETEPARIRASYEVKATRFEPAGFTNNPDLPIAKSITDYLFRWLQAKFLPQERQGEQLDLPMPDERLAGSPPRAEAAPTPPPSRPA